MPACPKRWGWNYYNEKLFSSFKEQVRLNYCFRRILNGNGDYVHAWTTDTTTVTGLSALQGTPLHALPQTDLRTHLAVTLKQVVASSLSPASILLVIHQSRTLRTLFKSCICMHSSLLDSSRGLLWLGGDLHQLLDWLCRQTHCWGGSGVRGSHLLQLCGKDKVKHIILWPFSSL